jgi:hypothetical protein
MRVRATSGILCLAALIASCSDEPARVFDSWSPNHTNRVRIEQRQLGGGYGGETYDVSLVDGNHASKLVSVAHPHAFSLIWLDDYHLVVRACGGDVQFLKSMHVLSKSLNSNDYDHIAFYVQPITIEGVSVSGHNICERGTS